MFGFEATEFDKKVYEEQLKDFLPEKIVDTHIHVSKSEFRLKKSTHWSSLVADDFTREDLLQTAKDMLPGKQMKAVIMGMPSFDHPKSNAYIMECIQKGDTGLFLTKPDTPLSVIEDAIVNKGFSGIKPYPCHLPSYIPASEVRIFDFVTPEQLSLANALGTGVTIHIGRDLRLKDPLNIHQLMEIDAKYPNAKVSVAHIGRAYSTEDIGDAFETLKHSRNLMFDFCANTLSEAMEECIKAVGVKRIMYGTDLPITKMRMRRITENGTYINVVPKGMYGDVSGDIHMRETDSEELTCFLYEEVLAFKRCAEKLSLTREDIEDVFCNNACRHFGIKF